MNADNTIILNGRLTRDVELTYLPNGTALGKFTVATNRSRKEADGTRKADFHNCVSFSKQAETIAQYFKKGAMIGVVGEYQDNNYAKKDGTMHYGKQILVSSFSFRESNKQPNQQGNAKPVMSEGQAPSIVQDDDLPF